MKDTYSWKANPVEINLPLDQHLSALRRAQELLEKRYQNNNARVSEIRLLAKPTNQTCFRCNSQMYEDSIEVNFVVGNNFENKPIATLGLRLCLDGDACDLLVAFL